MRAHRLRLELRHLVALDAVARHASFNLAAAELGYTQSAISQQIVVLERALGARVFERSSGPGRVRLTEPGRVVLTHARAVLARLEAASVDIAALTGGAIGELRVGVYQSLASRLLPGVVSAFRAQWPRIDVSLVESGSHDELDELVERGSLDLAFTIPPITREDALEYVELLRDPYRLVVAGDHPLAASPEPVTLDDLGAIDLVGYRVCRAHAQIERYLRAAGVEPRVVLRVEDNQLMQAMARQGIGAAIMPLLAIDPDALVRDLGDVLPHRRLGMIWHRDRHVMPPTQAFIDLTRQSAAALAGRLAG
jgi:DNA-binding transcriptional LysR family regulator